MAHCNVNIQDMNGLTALYIATRHGHDAITGHLIASDCDVDLQTKDEPFPLRGETALHTSACQGHEAVTK